MDCERKFVAVFLVNSLQTCGSYLTSNRKLRVNQHNHRHAKAAVATVETRDTQPHARRLDTYLGLTPQDEADEETGVDCIKLLRVIRDEGRTRPNGYGRRKSRFLYNLRPHWATNCAQHARAHGHHALVSKPCATHQVLITCNISCVSWYRETAGLFMFRKLKSHLFPVCRIG